MPPASSANSLLHSANFIFDGIFVIWNETFQNSSVSNWLQIEMYVTVQALSPKQTKCLQKLKIQNNELFLAKFV